MHRFMPTALMGILICLTFPSWADQPAKPADGLALAISVVPNPPDRGASLDALYSLYEKTGATAVVIPLGWAQAEPKDPGDGPSAPDLSALTSHPAVKSTKMKICHLRLANAWADKLREQNPARYWKLLEQFVGAVAKEARGHGVTAFSFAEEEPDRSGRRDWAQMHAELLKHVHPIVKAAAADSLVIGGGLSSGSDEVVQALYDAGAKPYFDVLDVHAFTDDPKAGVDVFQIVSAYRAMFRNDDGAKRIFVGAGWGPRHAVPGIERKDPKDAPSAAEIEAIRSFVENGYRNLVTDRAIYAPRWVFGATFSSLSDHYVGDKFCNAGLFDLEGKPKAALLENFPPKLPDHRFEAQLSSPGPAFNYVTDQPYNLELKITNLSVDEMKLDEFAVGCRGLKSGSLSASAVAEPPKTVRAGETAAATFGITIPKESANRQVTLIGELSYTFRDAKHFTDTWLTVVPTPALEVTLLPARAVIDASEQSRQIGMSIINHTDSVFEGKVVLTPASGLSVKPDSKDIKIDQYGLEAFVFTVTPDPKAAPGHYFVNIDVGGRASDWVAVEIPAIAKRVSNPPWIDGKLSDWSESQSFAIARFLGEKDGKSTYEKIGRGRFAYNGAGLYAAFEIDDDKHVQTKSGIDIISEDSLVIGFDPGMDGARTAAGGYKLDDVEYAFARSGNSNRLAKTKPTSGTPDVSEVGFAFAREGLKSVYEISVSWSELPGVKPEKGAIFGVGVAVIDSDGEASTIVEWGGGIAPTKDPRKFVPVMLGE